LVCNCPALFGFEYTVGQIWDKSISHGFRKGPIHIREGAKKPFREYRNEDGCHARTKTKKPFLNCFENIKRFAIGQKQTSQRSFYSSGSTSIT
jgi:hypothetical protein